MTALTNSIKALQSERDRLALVSPGNATAKAALVNLQTALGLAESYARDYAEAIGMPRLSNDQRRPHP